MLHIQILGGLGYYKFKYKGWVVVNSNVGRGLSVVNSNVGKGWGIVN